jgi:hypothetical protein
MTNTTDMENYDTVTEAVNDLVKRGYTENFGSGDDCIHCEEKNISLNPSEFVIDEVYRFEGDADPADETIVYAISALHSNIKGVLVNAYGMYSDSMTNEMVEKLKVH